MNTNPEETDRPDDASERQKTWLRALIRDCADLPTLVREADFARVDERLFDESLLNFLCAHQSAGTSEQAANLRVQRRTTALTPYVGKKLICVSIRLPGVGYTIEVDPEKKCIVHWEWLEA